MKYIQKRGINFERLQHFDSLGLVKFNNISSFNLEQQGSKGGQFVIGYGEHKFLVEIVDDRNTELSVGHVMYTQQGLELLTICSPENNNEFFKYLKLKIVKDGSTITDV